MNEGDAPGVSVPARSTGNNGLASRAALGSLRRPWDDYDVCLFDIDGTLMLCKDAVHYHAFCAALRMLSGRPLDLAGVTAHGNTDAGILRDALLQAGIPEPLWRPRIAEALDGMCAFVWEQRKQICGEVLPGVRSVLGHLRRRGVLLGVVTGNLERIGRIKLECCGLEECFDFGAYSDGCECRTEVFRNAVAQARSLAGTQATICSVGDTPADVKAAREVGIDVIALATGIHSEEQLQAERPDFYVANLGQLFALRASTSE